MKHTLLLKVSVNTSSVLLPFKKLRWHPSLHGMTVCVVACRFVYVNIIYYLHFVFYILLCKGKCTASYCYCVQSCWSGPIVDSSQCWSEQILWDFNSCKHCLSRTHLCGALFINLWCECYDTYNKLRQLFAIPIGGRFREVDTSDFPAVETPIMR